MQPEVHVAVVNATQSLTQVIVSITQALAALIGASAALFAAWSTFMPWCDLAHVKVIDDGDGGVKLDTTLRNAGRGQALRVWVELLEYGGVTGSGHWDNYVGPLAPGDSLPFTSHRLDLGGKTPQGSGLRVLMRWEALFGIHGESYVEDGFADGRKSRRKRIVVLFWWTRFSRWLKQDIKRVRNALLVLVAVGSIFNAWDTFGAQLAMPTLPAKPTASIFDDLIARDLATGSSEQRQRLLTAPHLSLPAWTEEYEEPRNAMVSRLWGQAAKIEFGIVVVGLIAWLVLRGTKRRSAA